jgi:hypothetical protein
MAEGVRFELTVELPLQRFSRPSPSTARPPLPLKKYIVDSRQGKGKKRTCKKPDEYYTKKHYLTF